MKVFAFNSSPRSGGQSKTELMLNHLIEGMRDAGAEVEVVKLREKTIKNCIGCFTCWTKSPGACIQKDDMTDDLFPKWLESDLVVYATPLYHYAMNATLKAFIERCLPSTEPFFKIHEGRIFHPVRSKCPAVVILSVSGMPDKDHFSALSAHVKYLFGSPGKRLLAEIYRPAAETMMNPSLKEKANDILDATKQAGKELVQSLSISFETMERITQPLIDPQLFAKMANLTWKTCIAEGVTLREFAEKKMVPRPYSLDSFMFLFPHGLNSKAIGDAKAVLQFKFSGEVEEPCYFTIEKGSVGATRGISEGPDLTIETPFNVWMDIMTRKADGRQMMMEQKCKVLGNLSLMMQLFQKA
jgi:FMN-dependent NADH-azoreductase/putative sterol carrier protein